MFNSVWMSWLRMYTIGCDLFLILRGDNTINGVDKLKTFQQKKNNIIFQTGWLSHVRSDKNGVLSHVKKLLEFWGKVL